MLVKIAKGLGWRRVNSSEPAILLMGKYVCRTAVMPLKTNIMIVNAKTLKKQHAMHQEAKGLLLYGPDGSRPLGRRCPSCLLNTYARQP